MYKNSEGYPDPTAGAAYNAIQQEERQQESDRLTAISALIPVMKGMAELAGFEVVGRSALKDKVAGEGVQVGRRPR